MNWSLLACSLWMAFNGAPSCRSDGPYPEPKHKSCPEYVISIDTRSDDGLVVDEITADLNEEAECRQSLADKRAFDCKYQGLGPYTLVLHSGKLTWTEKVDIEGDEKICHIKTLDLTIDVTRATADK